MEKKKNSSTSYAFPDVEVIRIEGQNVICQLSGGTENFNDNTDPVDWFRS